MARYSKTKIANLVALSDEARTADEKGEMLEQLAVYLFGKVRGVNFYAKNILDGNRAHELDVVFSNLPSVSEISFLEAILIVECKNTTNPVGSDEVGWFVRKLQDRAATCAVLLSLGGITGAATGVTSAHSEILGALVRDRIRILVITRDDVEALSSTRDLAELLLSKLLKLVTEKVVA